MSAGTIVALGDACVSMRFGGVIDPEINARCIAVAASLEASNLPGIRDIVPSYDAVTVHFNPVVTDRALVTHELVRLAEAVRAVPDVHPRTIEIPVQYGGASGPDLAAVAAFGQCSEADVIRLHTQTTYRVYMLGFLPGFAYMGTVDPRIAMPRLDTPRMRVDSGSVAIASSQTGIYPCDTPGGWRIVGRTAVRLFKADAADPFLLRAGDRVRFVAL